MDPYLVSLISGGCAGTATDLAFFPIDTIKTRLQAKGGFFTNGGWKGIYRGLGSAIVASAPSASLFFITYDGLKRNLNPIISEHTNGNEGLANILTHSIAASAGEVAACSVRVPAEVIKQRTQASHFSSSWHSLKHIITNQSGEGVFKGLYRGWGVTIFREIPFTVIQFPLYEYMKLRWARSENKQRLSSWQSSICGSIAGGFAAAVTTPLDVIKTRIMLHESKVSVMEITKSVIQDDGIKGFFRGIGPRTMWISAGGAIFLGVYELVSGNLNGQSANKLE
ncbi:Pet8 protein [Saccharomycopsis crataegensis]|uniref:Putative mitochondrial carrier protein PET8 n=1 Tax=Saccharomycopsis crataegensis TaxID=43959 RepID=A0AAV5QGH4_9ASCO|nr:Pet8 protein [Saccharomycopsis crataegensis]